MFIVSQVPSAFYDPVPPPVPTPIVHRSTCNGAPAPPPLAPAVRAARPTGTRVHARAAAGGDRGCTSGGDLGAVPYKSYGNLDVPNPLPEFKPTRIPGIHFERPLVRNTMKKAIDFLIFFFYCTHG